MEITKEISLLPNFVEADFTAIVSDLHLTEEHISQPDNPLWKRYKTRQFYFDDEFACFLDRVEERSKAGTEKENPIIELILNGDIFDFDSVSAIPEEPPYKLSWIEKRRGLSSEEVRSAFKMEIILRDHPSWFEAVKSFLLKGHRVIFIAGNHDLEIMFPEVQNKIRKYFDLPAEIDKNLRFCEWFYISNKDTLIEHGNQYDPYCVCANPIHPTIRKYNRVEMRIPFGNLATRYMINGMGFFNPYTDANFIMSITDYIKLFLKYMLRKQPFLVVTWFWSSCAVLFHSISDLFYPAYKDPLKVEDHIKNIAEKSNATPRMVRELRNLSVEPATSSPILIAQELWLDRAFLFLVTMVVLFQIFSVIKLIYDISFFWMFIPIAIFMPFIVFYSSSIRSLVGEFKEPRERVMNYSSQITNARRVIYGHTHIIRHEIIGVVEHLNSGTWSPAFLDIECTEASFKKTCVFIYPDKEANERKACVLEYKNQDLVLLNQVRT